MIEDHTSVDGLAQLQALLAKTRRPPIGEKMNFELVEVARGHAVFEGNFDRTVYKPIGSVHGGYAATSLDSACGIAVHSQLGPGQGYTTLELKVSSLRARPFPASPECIGSCQLFSNSPTTPT